MSTVFDVLDLIKKYGGRKPMESDFNDQCSTPCHRQGRHDPPGQLGGGHDPQDQPGYRHRLPARARGRDCGEGGDHVSIPTRPSGLPRTASVDAALAWLKWLTTSDVRQGVDPGQDQAALAHQGRKGVLSGARAGDGGHAGGEGPELPLVLPDVPHGDGARTGNHPPGILRRPDESAADPGCPGCEVHARS